MTEYYEMSCGCKFPIQDVKKRDNCDSLPPIQIDYENIRYDCPATWELLQSGQTKGVFQLETRLGQGWSKKISPENLGHLSALGALLRPGCLKSKISGKSMTELYADRKAGLEKTEYIHESLKSILSSTHGVLTFQEQAMAIAQKLAGFNLQEADVLRKAIGKKKADIMTKVKKTFMDGCAKTKVVPVEIAEQIFGWIQESQKYSFNASHSYSYGMIGYWTAYAKAHFPQHFFTAWLYYAKEKIDPHAETKQLVADAKNFEVDICPPLLETTEKGDPGDFTLYENKVYFGIRNVKRVGDSHIKKLLSHVVSNEEALDKDIKDFNWYEFLCSFGRQINKNTIQGIMSVGGLDGLNKSRTSMLFEYHLYTKLTSREKELLSILGGFSPEEIQVKVDGELYGINPASPDVINQMNILGVKAAARKKIAYVADLYNSDERCDNLRDGLVILSECEIISKNRQNKIGEMIISLDEPPHSLVDDSKWINRTESELLGISITCSNLDVVDQSFAVTATCKEFVDGRVGLMSLGVEINEVKEHVIKKKGNMEGMTMAFLTVQDDSGVVDSIIMFPDAYESFKHLLYPENTVLLVGERSDRDSLIVKKVRQI
jgi:DNA polymerase III alpha subunit